MISASQFRLNVRLCPRENPYFIGFHYVNLTQILRFHVQKSLFPEEKTVVRASTIEKRYIAIDRTDVFSTDKTQEDDGNGDACATQASTKRRDHDSVLLIPSSQKLTASAI